MKIRILAPAKINLDLRIVGRLPDGYHELRTLFQSIDLHDTVTLSEQAGPLTVRSRTAGVPRDHANLVWSAAAILWRALGRPGAPRGVAISIAKAIPMGGGLGGGSSDAASALRGLCHIWRIPTRATWLRRLAARVGADVPYFLIGGLVRGTGRGTRVVHLPDLEPTWVVLAIPRFSVSTADAYRWFDRLGRPEIRRLPARWRLHLDELRNDLEAPVATHHPEVDRMVTRLRQSGAVHAAMTGSGSTVFGLYRRQAEAVAARRAVRAHGWRTVICRTTGRAEFERVTGLRPA